MRFNDGNEIIFQEVIENLLKVLEFIKNNKVRLGLTEILFCLEIVVNNYFDRMIFILEDRAPIGELQKLVQTKLNILTDNNIKILWSYIKGDFSDSFYGFQYDEEILGASFFKVGTVGQLREKIAKYVTFLRAKIMLKRFKEGKTESPMFAFGVARILGMHNTVVKNFTLSEVTLIKIISRILGFWEKVLFGDKNELCAPLRISAEGRIVFLKPRDIDKDLDNHWFDFKVDDIKSYQVILCELRRLLKIANGYITRQTDIEKSLFQYKLKYEIFAKEKNREFKAKNAPNELLLQKELCAFLIERGIYSYGKSFGTHEIDLMVEQSGKTYVIETKIYKSYKGVGTFERRIKSDLIQLSEYLDREDSISAWGILVIYNLTDVFIEQPKKWIRKRFWILPINISGVTPSLRNKKMMIEESDVKNLIRCCFLDIESVSGRKKAIKMEFDSA